MNTKFPSIALSLGLLLSTAGAALADGTYVYGDGSTKDYYAGVPVPAPEPVPFKDAQWYLRFDIGGSFVGEVDVDVEGGGVVPRDAGEIPTSIFGEVGFGYRYNKNFRADFTTSFHDSYALTDANPQNYVARLSAIELATGDTLTNEYDVVRTDELNVRNQSTNLVNLYYDFANGSRFTPYVGAGVGVTYVNTDRRVTEVATCRQGERSSVPGVPQACFPDAGDDIITTSTQEEEHEWLFSGALMAGFSYDFNEYVAFDAGYRVLYSPGSIVRTSATLDGTNKATWADFLHHQFRTGLRLKIY